MFSFQFRTVLLFLLLAGLWQPTRNYSLMNLSKTTFQILKIATGNMLM